MKRIAILTLLAAGAAVAQAQPQFAPPTPAPGFVDRARVQNVEPQYEVVQTPRQECTSQWVTESAPMAPAAGGYGGAVVGGVAGAILGNQVGKGHGREAATAAGAVVGALAGDRIANSNSQPMAVGQTQREVRNCRTVNEAQNRLTGYRVTYEYQGQVYTTVMREQPGRTMPVRVSVTPLEERGYDRR